MAIEGKELPALIFWFLVSGIAIYATSKALGKVSEKIGDIFES